MYMYEYVQPLEMLKAAKTKLMVNGIEVPTENSIYKQDTNYFLTHPCELLQHQPQQKCTMNIRTMHDAFQVASKRGW